MRENFRENYFGRGSEDYARYRPVYPDELFAALAQRTSRGRAWDCGTGSGQAARGLAQFFDEVIATDSSADQIARARGRDNVDFRIAAAEASGLESDSVDLVTAATALHWFDHVAFWDEVSRVARSGALLAFWSYEQPRLSDSGVQQWFDHLASDLLADYWDDRVLLIRDAYAAVEPPFNEVEGVGVFECRARWSEPDDILSYCGTWSALECYRRRHGEDPRTEDLVRRLAQTWPDDGIEVVWTVRPRVFSLEAP